jgi:hypothetical protein
LTRFLLLAVIGGLTGCGDRAPTAVTPAPLLFDGPSSYTGLLQCTPLTSDSVSQTVGPLGGVLSVGPYRLWILPGALDAPVAITAVAPADTVNRVRFGPTGLAFRVPALLTMSYANCPVPPLARFVPKHIAYTSEALEIVELLTSVDDLWGRSVTARLEHFSDYAIAW